MNTKEAFSEYAHALAESSVMLAIIWVLLIGLLSPPDRPKIPSSWFLICPAICILLAMMALAGIRKSGHPKGRRWAKVGIVLNIILLVGGAYAIHSQRLFEKMRDKGLCAHELRKIGEELRLYRSNHHGAYPTPEKWCDSLLLVSESHAPEFVCPSSDVNFYYVWLKPNEKPSFGEEMILRWEQEDGNRQYVPKICTYAMNPDCEPNSPADLVLLFETKGGWNQYGGPELLTLDNHKGEGANVLFNDGHVKFIKPDEVGKLKWKAEPNEMKQAVSQ